MKIRNGFVSNSSSSSFCILGVYFDNAKSVFEALSIEAKIEAEPSCSCDIDRESLRSDGCKFCPKCGSLLFAEPDEWDFRERLDSELSKLDIGYLSSENWLFVGCDIGSENGSNVEPTIEKMQKTHTRLKELFGDDSDIRIYSGTHNY